MEAHAWTPADRTVTYRGSAFGVPHASLVYLAVLGALAAMLLAPGTLGDRIAAGGWAIVAAHVVSSVMSLRTRVAFRGWSVTSRTAFGRKHTFDVRSVRGIRRCPRPFERGDGLDYLTRIARRPHDFDVFVAGRSRAIHLPLHQFPYDGGPARELMYRVAMVPDVAADPDTAETLAAWRNVQQGPLDPAPTDA